MRVYDVKMYERASQDVVATYLGGAESKSDALVNCVKRAARAGKIGSKERRALIARAKFPGINTGDVDTGMWAFTVASGQAEAL